MNLNSKEDYNPDPPKRILNWNDFSINVSHEPGDRRFSMASPLNCSYGSIRKTYGQGADKKSIDVYIGNNLNSLRVFKITQLNNRGFFDEYKYIIGVKSLVDAELLYRQNVPLIYFGGIQETSINELKELIESGNKDIPTIENNHDYVEDTVEDLTQLYLTELFNFDAFNLDKKSSKVQSVLFKKGMWDRGSVSQWMIKHKMNPIKISEEGKEVDFIHARVIDPGSCSKIRTIDFSRKKGIIARICIP